ERSFVLTYHDNDNSRRASAGGRRGGPGRAGPGKAPAHGAGWRSGVLAGLITRRSSVQVRPPPLSSVGSCGGPEGEPRTTKRGRPGAALPQPAPSATAET